MALMTDHKYNGVVITGSHPFETQCGTCGYSVALECEDGQTEFTIWMTDKNRKNVLKYFGVLGVDVSKMQSSSYVENQLALDITGREVSFGTYTDEYGG